MAKIPKPHFNLKTPHSEESLIYLIYRYRGKKMKYSTRIAIKVSEWDFKVQRPIEKERRPDLWAIRRMLDDYATYAKTIYIEKNYGALSLEEFRAELDKMNDDAPKQKKKKITKPKKVTFFDFADKELAEMEATNMKHNSFKVFKRHIAILKDFSKDTGSFSFKDINWELRLKLIDWLAAKEVQLNYGNKTLSVLRQFADRARRKGLHDNTIYQGTGWKVRALKAVGTKVTLSENELSQLANMELVGYLKKVRDLFLVGAGTGQRYSDFSRLQPENFYRTIKGTPILSVISQKTATPAKIPLNVFPWLIPVLEEYEYQSPKMSMQKLNDGLKLLCKKAGFEEKVLVVEQYIGRNARMEKRYVPKYEMISSHTCRRSFATNMYRRGYSLSQIMLITGHSTESQLRVYIGIHGEENAEQIALGVEANNGKALVSSL